MHWQIKCRHSICIYVQTFKLHKYKYINKQQKLCNFKVQTFLIMNKGGFLKNYSN